MATRRTKKIAVEDPTNTCKFCRHCHVLPEGFALCRRFPPVVVYDTDDHDIFSTFPITPLDSSCGEFSVILNS